MASCFLLARLPPELRLQIYKHVLVRPLNTIGTTVDKAKKSRTAKRSRTIKKSRKAKKSQTAKHASRTAIFLTCRQIYSEAYPVLLSANTWVIRPNREDHTWLFGLGLQGQLSLRKIIFDSDYGYHEMWPTSFHFEIFNTLPSHTRLSLTLKAITIWLLQLYKKDTLKYMHGFAKATMDDLSNERGSCHRHGDLSRTLPAHLVAQRERTWKGLLDQLTSACPDDCEMHVGRPAANTQSTLHLSLTSACFFCEQRLNLHERDGMGFTSAAAKADSKCRA